MQRAGQITRRPRVGALRRFAVMSVDRRRLAVSQRMVVRRKLPRSGAVLLSPALLIRRVNQRRAAALRSRSSLRHDRSDSPVLSQVRVMRLTHRRCMAAALCPRSAVAAKRAAAMNAKTIRTTIRLC